MGALGSRGRWTAEFKASLGRNSETLSQEGKKVLIQVWQIHFIAKLQAVKKLLLLRACSKCVVVCPHLGQSFQSGLLQPAPKPLV